MYKINPRLSEPIYEQIVNEIKKNIYEEVLVGKDKIPSVREMARILTTNPNTVAKAYKELERQRIIEVVKGSGTYIVENPKEELKANENEIAKIKDSLKDAIVKGNYHGITKEQLKKWIDEI